MKYKIRTALLLMVVLSVLGGLMPVYGSIPEPTADFYASDLANVLSGNTINYIVEKNIALENKSDAQIVVVTVDFAGDDIESFGYDLFNDWGIGSDSEDNGVLILLAIGDDDWFGVTGTGLERVISSGTMNNLLWDYLDDDFSIGDYDAGVIKVFDAVYDILDKHYGVYDQSGNNSQGTVGGTTGTAGGSSTAPPPRSSGGGSNAGSGFVIFLLVLLIVFCVLVALLRPRRRYRPGPTYYGAGVPIYPVRRRRWWQRRPPPPPYHPYHPPHPPRGPIHGAPPRMSAGSPPRPSSGPAKPAAPKPAAPKSSGGLFSGGGGSTRGGVSRSSSGSAPKSTGSGSSRSSGGSISRPSGSSGGGISRSSGGSSRSSGSRSGGGSFRGGGGSTRGGGSSRGGGRK